MTASFHCCGKFSSRQISVASRFQTRTALVPLDTVNNVVKVVIGSGFILKGPSCSGLMEEGWGSAIPPGPASRSALVIVLVVDTNQSAYVKIVSFASRSVLITSSNCCSSASMPSGNSTALYRQECPTSRLVAVCRRPQRRLLCTLQPSIPQGPGRSSA